MHLLLLLSVVGVVSSQTCTKGQFYNDGGGNILAKVGDGQCLGPSNGRVLNREMLLSGCGACKTNGDTWRFNACVAVCQGLGDKCIGITTNGRSGDKSHYDECQLHGFVSSDDSTIKAAAEKQGMSNVKIVDRHRGKETSITTFQRGHTWVCYKKVPAEAGCLSCPANTWMELPDHTETSCTPQPTCGAGEGYEKGSTSTPGKCNECTPGTYMDTKSGHRSECKDWLSCGAHEYLAGATTTSAGTCKVCPAGQNNEETEHQLTKCKAIPKCKAGEFLHPGDDTLERLGNGYCMTSSGARLANREFFMHDCDTEKCNNIRDRLAACKQICSNVKSCVGLQSNTRARDGDKADECAILGVSSRDDKQLIQEAQNVLGWDSTGKWVSRSQSTGMAIAKASGTHSFECFKKTREGSNCRACPDLTYQTSGSHHDDECTPQPKCKAGQYLKDGDSSTKKGSCTSCPDGTFMADDDNQAAECKAQASCDAGQYLAESSTTAAGKCQACPAGTFMADSGHTSTECVQQAPCGAGEKFVGSTTDERTCATCDAVEEYQPNDSHTTEACLTQVECSVDERLVGASASSKGRCEACPSGQYRDAASHREGECVGQSTCGAGEKISNPVKGEKQTCSDCSDGTFQTLTSHRDTECIPHGTCSGSGEKVSTKGTRFKNAVCESLECSDTEFELEELSASNKKQCQELSVCGPGYRVTTAATRKSDLECGPCGPNTYTTANSNHRDLQCTPQPPCGKGERSTGDSKTSAIKCTLCPSDTYRDLSAHFETACIAQPLCDRGEYLKFGNAEEARKCIACPSGMYNDNQDHRDSDCTKLPTCYRGQYASVQGSATEPTECTDCEDGFYMDESSHRNTECKAFAICGAGEKYVPDKDKAGKCTSCGSNTFQTSEDHREEDCTAVTQCTSGQYLLEPYTPSSNAVCVDYGECASTEYETQAGTKDADRVCQEKQPCGLGQRVTDVGTDTTDRTCGDCDANSYEDATAHASTVCKPQPTCGPGEYISADSSFSARSCDYCPDGTYRKDSAHREEACIEGLEDMADTIAIAVDGVGGGDDTQTLDELIADNALALDAMENAVDVNEDALDAIEKKSNACKAGVGGETEESCALLLLQKTNAEAEYDSAVAMVEQLNSDKDKLDAATAQVAASAAAEAANSATTIVVVIAVVVIVAIVAAAIFVKNKQTVLVHSDMGANSFENPNYDYSHGSGHYSDGNGAGVGAGSTGYMDVQPQAGGDGGALASGYMDVSGGGGVHDHVGGGSSAAGYMDVAPAAAGGDAFGASDEEEV